MRDPVSQTESKVENDRQVFNIDLHRATGRGKHVGTQRKKRITGLGYKSVQLLWKPAKKF